MKAQNPSVNTFVNAINDICNAKRIFYTFGIPIGHNKDSGVHYVEDHDTEESSLLVNDASILNTSLNFNVCGLKDMLKCVSCHRFLFPPILQCAQGHMSCKPCFEIKGNFYSIKIECANSHNPRCSCALCSNIVL